MSIQIVRPATGRAESLLVAVAVALILAVSAGLIIQRRVAQEVTALKAYQISAFADLSKPEQGVYNDLYAAALELQTVRRDSNAWLSLDDMRDLAMPPFAPGPLDTARGGHVWSAVPDDDAPAALAIFGKAARPEQARSFLMIVAQEGPDMLQRMMSKPKTSYSTAIWVTANLAAVPPSHFEPGRLAEQGWKEAVAFKGDNAQRDIAPGVSK